ncbi:non-SMC mitotic condensation complex subunit 1 domain-containing protein [Ditylenchus destructor]|uniref:AP-3 complex subunit beta n=1 Tax=Ditylenchus destructor TaxID=166010 RepID=A0AAD4NEC9_9BILA|nr:non-SMC mitotic condensation complex subunit 1 domain-containing protein [Ditylenchus destructor]
MRMSYAEGLASPEIEIAEGGTMLDNKSKFADLKLMLDSNRESIKMDAMKRIINMVARGKDVSELFPAVVKNVAVKNLELKKLVYVYLVRYAEEQQDLALLSISTFQRALKDPNQLIRASALRVLSSIRVHMIAPVMLLAIKESVRDMSAYVRKVAAHAIPKLFALDSDLQPQLLECIDFLLADKRTLVLGSAVHAFEETCPDRLDILHRHFRPLCRALADVDEWGQIIMIGLLTRYARTQFTSPTSSDQVLDPDHSLLIFSAKPLLQSRNCAVVMAVAQLLYYIAPHSQLSIVPRSLVRLLRGPNEVQYVVLVNIATICASRNNMNLFEPFLKSFFIRGSDTIHVKQLKLQVLTSLVSETNVQLVIRELQAYLQMQDLAGSAIEAIGRCALKVESASDICLTCLINLISSSKESVVCAAVVVLKRLLHADAPLPLLKRVVKLIDSVKAPTARACVIWLVVTHIDKVEYLAPDLLRKVAKTFCDEADCVKLQALNLAVKLWVTDREKCELLIRYVLQLARYDRSYDIRDRCRFLRNLLLNPDTKLPVEIFLSEKPAPTLHSQFSDREHFQLGTLSHLLNQKCTGYTELPDFPEEQPDPTIRRNAHPLPSDQELTGQTKFQCVPKRSLEIFNEGITRQGAPLEIEEEAPVPKKETPPSPPQITKPKPQAQKQSGSKTKHVDLLAQKTQQSPSNCKPLPGKAKSGPVPQQPSNLDLLMDLDFNSTTLHSAGGVCSKYIRASTQYIPEDTFTLLSPFKSGGLSIDGKFSRAPSMFSNSMVSVELAVQYKITGVNEADISIHGSTTNQSNGFTTCGPVNITGLKPNERHIVALGIDFGDSGRSSDWRVEFKDRDGQHSKIFNMQIEAPFGEQIEAIDLSAEEFKQNQLMLSGMHQIKKTLNRSADNLSVKDLYKVANCKQVQGLKWCFAAQTVSRKDILLVSLVEQSSNACQLDVTVNCENFALASLLCKEIHEALSAEH